MTNLDLCVSAALDAVEEGVSLPWAAPKVNTSEAEDDKEVSEASSPESQSSTEKQDASGLEDGSPSTDPLSEDVPKPRILSLRHFEKALKEITPSSSESLGSLSALRKWNEEFGEGQKKKRKIMWGKGLFGFGEITPDLKPLDGHVSAP